MDGKIKAPPPAGRMWLVGLEIFGVWPVRTCWRFRLETPTISMPQAPSLGSANALPDMTTRDDDFNPRPGRIHHGNRGAKRPKTLRRRGDAGREESRPPRPNVQAKQRDCWALDLRPRTAGGAVPRLPLIQPARRHHGPDRAPPWRPISLGAALEASRLPQARRRHPRRR